MTQDVERRMIRIHNAERGCEECEVFIAPGQLGSSRQGCACLCHIPVNTDILAALLFKHVEGMSLETKHEMAQAMIDSVERQAKAFLQRLADHREGSTRASVPLAAP